MLENSKLKNCIVALDNATRPIGNEGEKTKLLKEYMYDLVEEMGWRGELKCFNEGVVKQSFASIQVTIRSNGDRAYSGSYDHIVEGSLGRLDGKKQRIKYYGFLLISWHTQEFMQPQQNV